MTTETRHTVPAPLREVGAAVRSVPLEGGHPVAVDALSPPPVPLAALRLELRALVGAWSESVTVRDARGAALGTVTPAAEAGSAGLVGTLTVDLAAHGDPFPLTLTPDAGESVVLRLTITGLAGEQR